MKTSIFFSIIIFGLFSCNIEKENEIDILSIHEKYGTIEIHKCFCSSDAYRFLIITYDNNDTNSYNPINLSEEYKDYNYKIMFSADLLDDSTIVYKNTETDALIEDFKVRNIKLTNIKKYSDFKLNDTLQVIIDEIYDNYENNLSITLDSVLNDSRCPKDGICKWAGNAEVRFKFSCNSIITIFALNTFDSDRFNADSLINDYRIKLINLNPYPESIEKIKQEDYIAEIVIIKE